MVAVTGDVPVAIDTRLEDGAIEVVTDTARLLPADMQAPELPA
jgi:hypothetical protein